MRKITFIILIVYCTFFNAQTVDSKGRKEGYWKKKNEKTNKLIYEGEFKDDKPVGKFKYYGTNDSLSAIMDFKEGGKFAYAKMFHLNGKRKAEGKYVGKEIKDSVKNFIVERFLKNSNNKELTDSTPLISGGIMDSISTMQLVTFLEKKYNFEFQAHEVDRDNLDTITIIANFVLSKIGG